MARIDVSQLLNDPDFVDNIVLINRQPSVNVFGENRARADERINTVGSVQPADYQTVMKLPEAMRVANVYSFWMRGQIVASEPGKYSSLIVYRGKTFQVQTVADWSNYGEGYTEGTCIAQVPA